METVSVIVPVYNVEAYVEKCVNSIRRQTWRRLEIILVDDGSTDASPQICDRLGTADARIRVIHQKNAGVSAARNVGLDAASGDYIAFCDADDFLEPDMYAYLIALLRRYEADISVCPGWYEYGKRHRKPFETAGRVVCMETAEAVATLHERKFLRAYLWNKLFCRELFADIRFRENLSFAEDYELLCRILDGGVRIVCGTEPKYHFIQRQSSTCNQGYTKGHREAVRMFGEYKEKYCRQYPAIRRRFENHYLFDMMGMLAAMSRNKTYVQNDCKQIQRYVRAHLGGYLADKSVPFYLKGSACAVCVHVRLFGGIYRLLHRADFE